MKRFVTYLYEYDRTVRGRNVGFIRNDIRNDSYRLEIHIRGLERIKEKSVIYLVVRDDGCVGIPAGEIIISQGVGNACLNLCSNQIGKTDYSIHQIQAVVIRYGNGKMLMGCYVQHPTSDLLAGEFAVWKEMDESASDVTRGDSDETGDFRPTSSDSRGDSGDTDVFRPTSSDSRGDSDETSDFRPTSSDSRGDSEDTDVFRPTSSDSRGVSDDTDVFRPASSDSQATSATYKRIAITDIRSLPSRNWHLCNNSFLIHGFFSYRYLILKTENTPDGAKMYLGVPGIYAQQERMMALLFGFNDFEPAQNEEETSENTACHFGYWLCSLET